MSDRSPKAIGNDIAEAGALLGDEADAVIEAAAQAIKAERVKLQKFAKYVVTYSNDPHVVAKGHAILGTGTQNQRRPRAG